MAIGRRGGTPIPLGVADIREELLMFSSFLLDGKI
jgi:hypothetical protein